MGRQRTLIFNFVLHIYEFVAAHQDVCRLRANGDAPFGIVHAIGFNHDVTAGTGNFDLRVVLQPVAPDNRATTAPNEIHKSRCLHLRPCASQASELEFDL